MPVRQSKLVGRLLAGCVLAFGFGFALVPLYDSFCRLTGLNGKNFGAAADSGRQQPGVDRSRTVAVDFTATAMSGLPLLVTPLDRRVHLHPGELQTVSFRVRNLSDLPVVTQAIPSVSPGQAAPHLEKLECFCFRRQSLAPGESVDLPVVFRVGRELDPDLRNLTLAYALFRAPDPELAVQATDTARNEGDTSHRKSGRRHDHTTAAARLSFEPAEPPNEAPRQPGASLPGRPVEADVAALGGHLDSHGRSHLR